MPVVLNSSCECCRASKVKCSGEKPCKRCAAKGYSCIYKPRKKRGKPRENKEMMFQMNCGLPVVRDGCSQKVGISQERTSFPTNEVVDFCMKNNFPVKFINNLVRAGIDNFWLVAEIKEQELFDRFGKLPFEQLLKWRTQISAVTLKKMYSQGAFSFTPNLCRINPETNKCIPLKTPMSILTDHQAKLNEQLKAFASMDPKNPHSSASGLMPQFCAVPSPRQTGLNVNCGASTASSLSNGNNPINVNNSSACTANNGGITMPFEILRNYQNNLNNGISLCLPDVSQINAMNGQTKKSTSPCGSASWENCCKPNAEVVGVKRKSTSCKNPASCQIKKPKLKMKLPNGKVIPQSTSNSHSSSMQSLDWLLSFMERINNLVKTDEMTNPDEIPEVSKQQIDELKNCMSVIVKNIEEMESQNPSPCAATIDFTDKSGNALKKLRLKALGLIQQQFSRLEKEFSA